MERPNDKPVLILQILILIIFFFCNVEVSWPWHVSLFMEKVSNTVMRGFLNNNMLKVIEQRTLIGEQRADSCVSVAVFPMPRKKKRSKRKIRVAISANSKMV